MCILRFIEVYQSVVVVIVFWVKTKDKKQNLWSTILMRSLNLFYIFFGSHSANTKIINVSKLKINVII